MQEFSYFLFVFTMTWLLPLLVMIGSNAVILMVIYRRAGVLAAGGHTGSSCQGIIGKAKLSTNKVTYFAFAWKWARG